MFFPSNEGLLKEPKVPLLKSVRTLLNPAKGGTPQGASPSATGWLRSLRGTAGAL
jgi:hypothetical protein